MNREAPRPSREAGPKPARTRLARRWEIGAIPPQVPYLNPLVPAAAGSAAPRCGTAHRALLHILDSCVQADSAADRSSSAVPGRLT